jgi:hypothetical protein
MRVKRTLNRAICAALLGGSMLAVAAPAASAADSWSEPSHDFGNQNVGSTSEPQTFAITATCDAFSGIDLHCDSPPGGVHNYGAITTTGPFAIDPATDVCNARGGLLLTPGAGQPVDVCTLQIAFKPTSGGVKNGTLSTTTSPSGLPLTVTLKGTGILTGNGTTTAKKKCKKKKKSRLASSAKKKCKKK